MRACVCVCECYAGAHAGFANSSNTNKGRFASLNDDFILYILSLCSPVEVVRCVCVSLSVCVRI